MKRLAGTIVFSLCACVAAAQTPAPKAPAQKAQPLAGFWLVIWRESAKRKPKKFLMSLSPLGRQLALPDFLARLNRSSKTDERSAWHDINR